MTSVRGIRGATTVYANEASAITEATAELLQALRALNDLRAEDIGYVWFTVTEDLDAAFPADAARVALGWTDVPLICGREIPVLGALARCIRVLIAYGDYWFPWYMRRLAERPANVWFVVRNVFAR